MKSFLFFLLLTFAAETTFSQTLIDRQQAYKYARVTTTKTDITKHSADSTLANIKYWGIWAFYDGKELLSSDDFNNDSMKFLIDGRMIVANDATQVDEIKYGKWSFDKAKNELTIEVPGESKKVFKIIVLTWIDLLIEDEKQHKRYYFLGTNSYRTAPKSLQYKVLTDNL